MHWRNAECWWNLQQFLRGVHEDDFWSFVYHPMVTLSSVAIKKVHPKNKGYLHITTMSFWRALYNEYFVTNNKYENVLFSYTNIVALVLRFLYPFQFKESVIKLCECLQYTIEAKSIYTKLWKFSQHLWKNITQTALIKICIRLSYTASSSRILVRFASNFLTFFKNFQSINFSF